MSIVQDRLNRKREIEEKIISEVEEENFAPSEDENIKVRQIVETISERFAMQLRNQTKDELKDDIAKAIVEECEKLNIPFKDQKRIEKRVLLTSLGYGPIEKYLQDPSVTEIVVQRYDNIVIERNGKIEMTDTIFYSEEHLENTIKAMVQKAGRQINLMNPIADASLEDGSRINAVFPPVAVDGATLTIRKFSNHALIGRDYIEKDSLSKKMLYFLKKCVEGRLNIIVSGGTGTGKTTLLNMLSGFIPHEEIIVTIEDTPELKLQQPNVRRNQIRNSINDDMMDVNQQALVKAALRQRPDRIILGEIRDGTVVDLVSAASTGHDGTMCTVHANDPRNLCGVRIPILYAMNPTVSFTERSISMQFSEAFHLIVQIKHFPDGSRKITQITHIDGIDKDGNVKLKDIFKFNEATKEFEAKGYVPEVLLEKLSNKGVSCRRDIFEKNEVKDE